MVTLLSNAASAFIVPKHANNVSGKAFLDLSMTRNRLRDPCVGVAIPIVLCSVSNQNTTEFFDRLDTIDPFHESHPRVAAPRLPWAALFNRFAVHPMPMTTCV